MARPEDQDTPRTPPSGSLAGTPAGTRPDAPPEAGPRDSAMGTGRPGPERGPVFQGHVDLGRTVVGGEPAGVGGTGPGLRGTPGAGGSGPEGKAADATAGGPATPATGGAAGSTGTTGYGSGATGHPAEATGGEAPAKDRAIEPSPEDRARGVVSQRSVSVLGASTAARDARAAGGGFADSGAVGASGSGSTSDVPGGRGWAEDDVPGSGGGTVGGTSGIGAGGPVPSGDPFGAQRGRGGGARDTAGGAGDTRTPEGGALADHLRRQDGRRMSPAESPGQPGDPSGTERSGPEGSGKAEG